MCQQLLKNNPMTPNDFNKLISDVEEATKMKQGMFNSAKCNSVFKERFKEILPKVEVTPKVTQEAETLVTTSVTTSKMGK